MGYIYLILQESEKELYKIGVSKKHPNINRIKALQTGNPYNIRLIHLYQTNYPYKLEKMLHRKFKNNQQKGEWFELSDNDVINFIHICDKFNQTIKLLINENPFYK